MNRRSLANTALAPPACPSTWDYRKGKQGTKPLHKSPPLPWDPEPSCTLAQAQVLPPHQPWATVPQPHADSFASELALACTHLAVLDKASEVFKAIVAEEGGLENWPVLADQHHGDGICGRGKGESLADALLS